MVISFENNEKKKIIRKGRMIPASTHSRRMEKRNKTGMQSRIKYSERVFRQIPPEKPNNGGN
ncbi:MAG: hypothetical protein ACFFCZ_02900 [Promethearchaeota archaeon]